MAGMQEGGIVTILACAWVEIRPSLHTEGWRKQAFFDPRYLYLASSIGRAFHNRAKIVTEAPTRATKVSQPNQSSRPHLQSAA